MRTHPDAPRVLIANSNLVGRWSTWEVFRDLEAKGLMMYGQMTAGSWIYIGTQGILQGTYETFAQAGRTHFGSDDLSGRLVLSGGLGGMGGRAAPGGHDERRGLPRRGGGPRAGPAPGGAALPRRHRPRPRRRAGPGGRGPVAEAGAVDRGDRQRGGRVPRARAPGHRAGPGDRPDLGARSAERVCPPRPLAGRGRRAPAHPPRGARPAGAAVDGRPGPGDAGHEGRRAATSSTTGTTSAPAPRPPG